MNVRMDSFRIAFNALKGNADRLGVDLTVRANLEFLTETAVVTAQAHEMLRAAETLEQRLRVSRHSLQDSRVAASSRLASIMLEK